MTRRRLRRRSTLRGPQQFRRKFRGETSGHGARRGPCRSRLWTAGRSGNGRSLERPQRSRAPGRWPLAFRRPRRSRAGATLPSTRPQRPMRSAAATVRSASTAARSKSPGSSASAGARRLGMQTLRRTTSGLRGHPYSLHDGRHRRGAQQPPRWPRRDRPARAPSGPAGGARCSSAACATAHTRATFGTPSLTRGSGRKWSTLQRRRWPAAAASSPSGGTRMQHARWRSAERSASTSTLSGSPWRAAGQAWAPGWMTTRRTRSGRPGRTSPGQRQPRAAIRLRPPLRQRQAARARPAGPGPPLRSRRRGRVPCRPRRQRH